MVTVILTHEVSNYAEWKIGFKAGEPLRQQASVKTIGTYHSVDNPNLVSIITEFPSVEVARGFVASPQLKADMDRAGVVGNLEVKILNQF
jgi:hypothetical protein